MGPTTAPCSSRIDCICLAACRNDDPTRSNRFSAEAMEEIQSAILTTKRYSNAMIIAHLVYLKNTPSNSNDRNLHMGRSHRVWAASCLSSVSVSLEQYQWNRDSLSSCFALRSRDQRTCTECTSRAWSKTPVHCQNCHQRSLSHQWHHFLRSVMSHQ
jgi:hypothetical protein